MDNFEVSIKTKIGEIKIRFNDNLDLEKKLSQINEFVEIIEKSGLSTPEVKLVEGLEKIYTTSDGLPRLLKIPKLQINTIRLALFVAHNPINLKEITKITGIKKPYDLIRKYSDIVKMPNDTYSLDPKGKREVSEKIIPNLLKKDEK